MHAIVCLLQYWVDNCESGVVKQVSTTGGLSQLQGSVPGIVGDSIST
jgi:hypothetical protein